MAISPVKTAILVLSCAGMAGCASYGDYGHGRGHYGWQNGDRHDRGDRHRDRDRREWRDHDRDRGQDRDRRDRW